MKSPAVYRITRSGFAPWVELRVFKTTKAMALWIKSKTGLSDPDGIGFTYVRNGSNHLGSDPWLVAVICLSEEHLGVSTVAHEASHAAMAWIRTVNGYQGALADRPILELDEPLAEVIGDLCREMYDALYAHGHCQPGQGGGK